MRLITKVLCSTWHFCWGLTPKPAHDGICQGACSLSCQSIFFCLLEAIILLTQWATQTSTGPTSPGQLSLLLKRLGHTITSISSFPLTQNPYNPEFEEQLSAQEWSKEEGFFSLSPRCHGAKAMKFQQREISVPTEFVRESRTLFLLHAGSGSHRG